jgi:hypothetical protein
MSTSERNWATGFCCIGVVMTVACLALILAGNTESAYRFEHTGFPLSWACAAGAVLAFLAAELCQSADSSTDVEEPAHPEIAPRMDAVEV